MKTLMFSFLLFAFAVPAFGQNCTYNPITGQTTCPAPKPNNCPSYAPCTGPDNPPVPRLPRPDGQPDGNPGDPIMPPQ